MLLLTNFSCFEYTKMMWLDKIPHFYRFFLGPPQVLHNTVLNQSYITKCKRIYSNSNGNLQRVSKRPRAAVIPRPEAFASPYPFGGWVSIFQRDLPQDLPPLVLCASVAGIIGIRIAYISAPPVAPALMARIPFPIVPLPSARSASACSTACWDGTSLF